MQSSAEQQSERAGGRKKKGCRNRNRRNHYFIQQESCWAMMVAKRSKTSGGSQSSPPPAPESQSKQEREGAACANCQADYSLCSPRTGHLALLSLLVLATTAATVVPHLGNMKHSPKIHIKRPTNKSNLKVRVVAAWAREELFWEAAEDKCCWCLGNAGQLQNTERRAGRTGQQEQLARPELEAAHWTVCKLFGVWWGGVLMHHHLVSSGTLLFRKLMQFLC